MTDINQAISPETTAAPVAEQNITTSAAPVVESQPIINNNVPAQAEAPSDITHMLAEDLKSFAPFKNFKDVNELAKSYLHAQNLIGKRIQDLQGDDLKHIHTIKGAPKEHNEYQLPNELTGPEVDWYKKTAFEAGLTQDQAKKVVDSYVEMNRQVMKTQHAQKQSEANEWVSQLKQEYGSAFENRVEIAKRAVDAFGGQELKDLLNKSGLGNNPTVVKMFAKIGANLLEDQLIESDYKRAVGLSPADAKIELNNKLTETEFRKALYSAGHPAHTAAVAEYERLLQAMHS